MIFEHFLVRHLLLYEASERVWGMCDKEEWPPKAYSCGRRTLSSKLAVTIIPNAAVSKERGLLNVLQQASTNNQHRNGTF